MSVLCEFLSVITTRSALEVSYPGGVAGFRGDCPNATFCSDEFLTRVGFMHPDDVEAFIDAVVRRTGLTILEDGRFVDLAVVDQLTGPTRTCDWLDFKRNGEVTRAWLSGTSEGEFAVPEGWTGPSQYKFYTAEEAEGIAITTSRGGPQQVLNPTTGETEYVGRTSEGPAGTDAHFVTMLQARLSASDAIGALEVCVGWTEQRSTSSRAWYELGLAQARICRMDLAEEAWRRAVGIAPDFEEALANLGVAIFEQGRPTEAGSWLERALALDAHDPVALLHRGKSLLVTGEQDQAKEHFERAVIAARSSGMRGVELEAAKSIDDLPMVRAAREDLCPACDESVDSECECCEALICGNCAMRDDDGCQLCDDCFEASEEANDSDIDGAAPLPDVAADLVEHEHEAAPAERVGTRQEAAVDPGPMAPPRLQHQEPSEAANGRQVELAHRIGSPRKVRSRFGEVAATCVAVLLFLAVVDSGGVAFLPNHPEITIDATRDYLSPQGLAARLDDACAKPPIWARPFKKVPREITVHATNQLGENATLVLQCRDGHVDPEDEGSIVLP